MQQAGTRIVNQVQFEYNGWRQLTADYQSHEGAVTGSTPKVGYLYTEGACYGSRPLGLVYPNGRVIQYGYGSAIDHHLGRVSSLSDCGCHPDQRLVEYKYLGANSIIRVDYLEPNLRCDLAHGSGSSIYAGIDRFGNVIDPRWPRQPSRWAWSAFTTATTA